MFVLVSAGEVAREKRVNYFWDIRNEGLNCWS